MVLTSETTSEMDKQENKNNGAVAGADTVMHRTAYKIANARHRRRPSNLGYIEDLKELIDFSSGSIASDPRIITIPSPVTEMGNCIETIDSEKKQDGVDVIKTYAYRGTAYGLNSHKDFLFIPQALSEEVQIELAHQSLTEFIAPPHATNIDLTPMKKNEIQNGPSDSMWNLWKKAQMKPASAHAGKSTSNPTNACSQTYDDGDAGPNSSVSVNTKKINNSQSASLRNSKKPRTKKPEKPGKEKRYYKSFEKLAWATTGYHYDWTARAYVEERKSPMPEVLLRLGSIFAELDLSSTRSQARTFAETVEEKSNADAFSPSCTRTSASTTSQEQISKFIASASIVNYYSLKANMGGHRDDLELDFTKPVVSLSLGLPGVFLLGGKTKDCSPVVPILIRPGDVILLAGDSRLCYHGMARVVPDSIALPLPRRNELQICSLSEIGVGLRQPMSACDLEAVKSFLSSHRININLRQVLPAGMDRIPKRY